MQPLFLVALFALCAAAQFPGYYLDTTQVNGRTYPIFPATTNISDCALSQSTIQLGTGSGFTFEAWVNYADSGSDSVLIFQPSGNNTALYVCGPDAFEANNTYSWAVYITTGTHLVVAQIAICQQSANTTLFFQVTSATALPVGYWTQVAVAFGESYGVFIYINGTSDAQFVDVHDSWNSSDGTSLVSTAPLTLFESVGFTDEYRLWNYARLPDDILLSFCTRVNTLNSALVAYWSFDQAPASSETIIVDQSIALNNLCNNPTIPLSAFIVGEPPLCSSSWGDEAVRGLEILLLLLYLGAIGGVIMFWTIACCIRERRKSPIERL